MCPPGAYSVTENNARNAPKPFLQKSLKNFWKRSTAQIPSVMKEKPLPHITPNVSLQQDFYARKQNASRILAIIWASVRLPVCLSVCHTRDLYQTGAS